MKFVFFLGIVFLISSSILADTKILKKFKITENSAERNEQISVNNSGTPEEELVIEGTYSYVDREQLNGLGIPFPVYTLEATYVADRNGYHVKYRLEGTIVQQLSLTPSVLKSLTG